MPTRWAFITCVILIATTTSRRAQADRCIGPKDNTAAVGFGVPAISPSDITWCDDFDSYCDNDCGDACCSAVTGADCTKCQSVWPAHSVWPGYQPSPDNVCSATALDPDGCPNDSSEFYFRRPFHWPRPTLTTTHGGWASSAPGLLPTRWEGWDGNPGWITDPYTVQYQGGTNSNQYHTFDISGAVGQKFAGSNAIDGTDLNPLTLRFWMSPGTTVESIPNLPLYVELRMDNDHAPTDWVMRNCAPQAQGPYPVVCQQNNHPGDCPPLSTTVHASLAFGWLAQLDNNPCDVETGRKPTQYHAAVFDGNRWFQLNGSTFPGQVDRFNYDTLQGYFEMKIKSTTIELKLIAPRHNTPTTLEVATSTATLPRKYIGPFNRVSLGASPGCALDPNTGQCLDPANAFEPWRYMAGHGDWSWSNAFVDRIAILGGIGSSSEGACCQENSCSVLSVSACQTAGGIWRGVNTTCDGTICNGACCEPLNECADTAYGACSGNFRGIGTSCAVTGCPCPVPWADVDQDGDADMNDFSYFQACYNPSGVDAGCQCYDRNHDNRVDADDFTKFTSCASGPNIPIADPVACDQFP